MTMEQHYKFNQGEFNKDGFNVNDGGFFLEQLEKWEIDFHARFSPYYSNCLFANYSTMKLITNCLNLDPNEECGMDLINGEIDIDTFMKIDKHSKTNAVYAIGSQLDMDEPMLLLNDEEVADGMLVLKYIPDIDDGDSIPDNPIDFHPDNYKMHRAPTSLYNCPNCENLISVDFYYAENSVIRRKFSDERVVPPSAPEFPVLTKCSKCKAIFWTTNLERIGKYRKHWPTGPDNRIEKGWEKAEIAKFLTLDEYIDSLTNCLNGSTDKDDYDEEVFIRQRIVWGFNDRLRTGESLFYNDTEKRVFTDNIYRLSETLYHNNLSERRLSAELHRYLGEFEKCMEILNTLPRNTYNDWVIEKFEIECNLKNTIVFEYPMKEYNTRYPNKHL